MKTYHVTRWQFSGGYFLAIALAAAGVWFMLDDFFLGSAILVGAGLVMVVLEVLVRREKIQLGDSDVILARGLLSTTTTRLAYNKIVDIQISQSPVQKILRYGDIKIKAFGGNEEFKNVASPFELSKAVKGVQQKPGGQGHPGVNKKAKAQRQPAQKQARPKRAPARQPARPPQRTPQPQQAQRQPPVKQAKATPTSYAQAGRQRGQAGPTRQARTGGSPQQALRRQMTGQKKVPKQAAKRPVKKQVKRPAKAVAKKTAKKKAVKKKRSAYY